MQTNPPPGFSDIPRDRLAALPFFRLNAAEHAVIQMLMLDVFSRPNDGHDYTCTCSREDLAAMLSPTYARHAVYGALENLRAKGLVTLGVPFALTPDWPSLLPAKYQERIANFLNPRRN